LVTFWGIKTIKVIKIVVLWDVRLSSLVESNQCFGGILTFFSISISIYLTFSRSITDINNL
jgi:5-bromo-4-chloroindolyl phosphate hydrolysis protein